MKLKLEMPTAVWVSWFAWRPVVTQDYFFVWLETIERQYIGSPHRSNNFRTKEGR